MAEIAGELERLYDAVDDPDSVSSTELLVEEIAARTGVFASYDWDPDKVGAVRSLVSGMRIELVANLEEQRICLRLEWTSTGSEERRNLGKYVRANGKGAADRLKSGGWARTESEIDSRSVVITSSIASHEAVGRVSDIAGSIDHAARDLQFND
jgi:hypothetical protein